MNKKSGRYSVSPEEDYENGSNGEVLKNKLEIKTRHEIEMLGESELIRAELELMEQYGKNQRFTSFLRISGSFKYGFVSCVNYNRL